MTIKFVFKSIFSLTIAAALLVSCDKDYTDVGSGLIDGNHFDFERNLDTEVSAYNINTGIVQTNHNGLATVVSVNPFGILDNSAFGKTKANFVTQAELATLNPTFGNNVVIKDVILSVPYFSTKTATSTTGDGTYTLDSIYGDRPIKLSVFESGYYINNLNPEGNFQSELKFYNNDQYFENYRKGALPDGTSVFNGPALNDAADASQNDSFVFSDKEIVIRKTDEDGVETVTRSVPAMRLSLNKNYFKKKILDAPADKLNNQDRFKDYFRGLYFKVEQSAADPSGKGSLAMLDFTKGTITVSYTQDLEIKDENGNPKIIAEEKTIIIKLAGNRISLLEENASNQDYINALAATGPDSEKGDSRLYVKGGQGSMAVIDLFGKDLTGDPVTGLANGIPDQLEEMRARGWMINEANLTFYVDTDKVTTALEPQRLYLYDVKNRRPLYDYSIDASTNSLKPKNSRSVYGGILQKETKNGVAYKKYKFRITRYLDNLVNKDSTNVHLGLVVTEGINEIKNNSLKAPVTLSDSFKIDRMPAASVLNPLGTILWGATPDVPEDVRLKLEIYYTKQKP